MENIFKDTAKAGFILVIGLFLLLFSLSSVSGSMSSLGTFEKGGCIDLLQTTPDYSVCNITSVISPNSTVLLGEEVEMEREGTEFNYTFCNTSESGEYKVNGYCGSGSSKETWNYFFEVTPTGQEFTTGKSLGGLGIIGIAISLSFLFVFVGYKFSDSPNKNLMPIGFFFVVFGFIMAIFALHLGYSFSSDVMQYESLAPVTSAIYISFLWSFIGIAIISSALMLISFIRELSNVIKKKKFGDDFDPISGVYQ